MNLKDFKYAVTLADTHSFNQAAEKCFISQPTLSNQIKKLEETLCITLFERSNKQVLLTETGARIIHVIRKILNDVDVIKEIAQDARDPFSSTLRLGAFPTIATYIFPGIIKVLRDELPKIQPILFEEKTNQLIHRLKINELDAALLALPVEDTQLRFAPLFQDDFYLAVPNDHPLASRSNVSQRDLSDYPLLLLEEGHCLRDQTLAICKEAKSPEETRFLATSLETIRQLVRMGIGITLIPKIAIRAEYNNLSEIRYIPFAHPTPRRTIALVWRKTSSKHTLLSRLTALLRDILPD